jgi:ATP-binding protein involved in chromosome partitioning
VVKQEVVFIKKIEQRDNTHFSITWSDGGEQTFKLATLQRQCPCAGCVDEQTGQRRQNPSPVPEDVRAVRVLSVGRYALRIHYTSGCSNGIYSYTQLRGMSHV